MGRKGKKRADEDVSDPDVPRPSKKPARSAAGDDILVCKISNNRRVAVRSWGGKVMVDIREFYEKNGEQLPGKKGISLPMDQDWYSSVCKLIFHSRQMKWKILRDHVEEIDKAMNENEVIDKAMNENE